MMASPGSEKNRPVFNRHFFTYSEAMTEPDLRYPMGEFVYSEESLTATKRLALINQLADLPAQLTAAVAEAGSKQMLQRYRPGGWTRHQLIHHVADSHLNGYVRFRLTLTEEVPTIKPYNEKHWAELPDVNTLPVADSLSLLMSLHVRWVALLRHLSEAQWQRPFYHPEQKRLFTLDQSLALYAWHGRHHLAHVTSSFHQNTEVS